MSWSRWPMCVIPRGSLAPALKPDWAGHRRVDLVVAGNLFLELPERDVVLLDPGRTAVAVDLGALEQPRIGTRGGLDHAQRAVPETQRSDGRILDFDPRVGQRGRVRSDRFDVAHQPVKQIDVVNRLIHERTAAVELPRSAPAAGVVVLLGAPPFDVRIAQREPAEAAQRRSPPSGAGWPP